MPRCTTAPTPPTGEPPCCGLPGRAPRWPGVPRRARPGGRSRRPPHRRLERGLKVTAWPGITQTDRRGAAVPPAAVRNAFGDGYPWALCPASPAVREYATTLAGEIAALPEADAIELEACGWYGIEHLSAHDKTAGVAAAAPAQWLLSICFCAPGPP